MSYFDEQEERRYSRYSLPKKPKLKPVRGSQSTFSLAELAWLKSVIDRAQRKRSKS